MFFSKTKLNTGSMPEEHPAIIEMEPVGAITVLKEFLMPYFLILFETSFQSKFQDCLSLNPENGNLPSLKNDLSKYGILPRSLDKSIEATLE